MCLFFFNYRELHKRHKVSIVIMSIAFDYCKKMEGQQPFPPLFYFNICRETTPCILLAYQPHVEPLSLIETNSQTFSETLPSIL